MKIIKVGNNKFNVKVCSSILSQFLGMMFSSKDVLLIFYYEIPVSLHTFFVFSKIDIIYFNKNKEVVKIIKNIKPFTFYISAVKSKYILETKNSKNIKLKDKLLNDF